MPNPRHLLRIVMLMLVLVSFYAPTVASTSHASSKAHIRDSSAAAENTTRLVSSYIASIESQSREYVRDAFGRVVGEKDETGDTTWFGHDGMHRVIQSSPGPDSYFYTINGTDPDNHYLRISARNLKQRVYYHQDRLGSVVGVSSQRDPSAQPKVEEWSRFEAYGNITRYDGRGDKLTESPVANRFGFQGQVHDQSVGLVNMRARMYSPDLGRFLSRDPIGLAGGSNQFAFVGGAPLSYTDPTGLAKKNGEALSAGDIMFRLERDGPMGRFIKQLLLLHQKPAEHSFWAYQQAYYTGFGQGVWNVVKDPRATVVGIYNSGIATVEAGGEAMAAGYMLTFGSEADQEFVFSDIDNRIDSFKSSVDRFAMGDPLEAVQGVGVAMGEDFATAGAGKALGNIASAGSSRYLRESRRLRGLARRPQNLLGESTKTTVSMVTWHVLIRVGEQ